ncbi:hypothetical protein PIIN_10124 [Serendipita indica DSM 11827]|uniref:Uncharacterized protein n=1 Tax=Serendipita indica (strain DSM 11827) TaxID=1109443 RepID=G4TXT1_SERID|nr:hypothetical protein PIIN_10124 [Serendipita indica DSM 11827]
MQFTSMTSVSTRKTGSTAEEESSFLNEAEGRQGNVESGASNVEEVSERDDGATRTEQLSVGGSFSQSLRPSGRFSSRRGGFGQSMAVEAHCLSTTGPSHFDHWSVETAYSMSKGDHISGPGTRPPEFAPLARFPNRSVV